MFNNQLIVEQKIAYVMAPSLATGATHEPQESQTCRPVSPRIHL
jgi:hypothetical protein